MIDENGPEVAEAMEIAAAHVRARRFDAARAVFGKVLEAAPNHVGALGGMATLMLLGGQGGAALPVYAKILAIDPTNDEAESNRAVVYFQSGDPSAAELGFRRVLGRKPDHADAAYNLARCVLAQGRVPEAAALYDRVMVAAPDDPRGYAGQGDLAQMARDPARAAAYYRRALKADPAMREAALGLVGVLHGTGQTEAAMAAVERALLQHPGDGAFEQLRAILLLQGGKVEQAMGAFEAAKRAGNPAALLPLARLQASRGALKAATLAFFDALGANPHDPEVKLGLAEVLYQDGEFARAGMMLDDLGPHPDAAGLRRELTLMERSDEAPWTTLAGGLEPPKEGSDLVIDAVRGDMADVLVYLRLARGLAERHGRITVRTVTPLMHLVSRVDGVSGVIDAADADGLQRLGTFEALPIQALPQAAAARGYDLPARFPYLTPDPARKRPWGPDMFAGNQPKVGLAWQRTPFASGPGQALLLEDMAPILRLPGLKLYSFGGPPEMVDRRRLGDIGAVDLAQVARDPEDLAAALAELDLVIAADNVTAHVAGAMGREVWLLLPTTPHWRWGRQGQDAALYPSFRLFRQERSTDWTGAIQFVTEELTRRYGLG
jgi:tetratricopeptide (TPR) repeat protein